MKSLFLLTLFFAACGDNLEPASPDADYEEELPPEPDGINPGDPKPPVDAGVPCDAPTPPSKDDDCKHQGDVSSYTHWGHLQRCHLP